MKLSIKNISVNILLIASIIPAYWFLGGSKLLNIVYLFATFAFLFSKTKIRIRKINLIFIYLLTLFIGCLQILKDSSFTALLMEMISSLFIVIIISQSISTKVEFYNAIDFLIYLCSPLLILGVLEAIMGYNIFQNFFLTYSSAYFYKEIRLGIFRIASVFGHPIVYCHYLSLIGALVLYRLDCNIPEKKKHFFQIIYFLLIINVLFTLSRSFLLVFVAEQIVFLFVKGIKLFSKKSIFIGFAAIILLITSELLDLGINQQIGNVFKMIMQVFGLDVGDYSTDFSNTGYNSVEGDRLRLYSWVTMAVGDNVLFGKGTNAQFSFMASEYREKTSIENYYLSTINNLVIKG